MKKILFCIALCCPLLSWAADKKDTITFRVLEYNVENLFDTQHDSLKNDYEFTPTAIRHWGTVKYRKKLNDIAKAIATASQHVPVSLVGLCEVENDTVMRHLATQTVLREWNYKYIMTNSPDKRGIDVALMYQEEVFSPLQTQFVHVPVARDEDIPTRDILHVAGRLPSGDTLDVFVAHWPSRGGGERYTDINRVTAAHIMKHTVDSVLLCRTRPMAVLMGDFNDYPANKSIRKTLDVQIPLDGLLNIQANKPKEVKKLKDEEQQILAQYNANPNVGDNVLYDEHQLYHLLMDKTIVSNVFGSYKYQGEWGLLDHIIVSGRLLMKDSSLRTGASKADNFHPAFLLEEDPYGGNIPFRTYAGVRYKGGTSDHLPVYADFVLVY